MADKRERGASRAMLILTMAEGMMEGSGFDTIVMPDLGINVIFPREQRLDGVGLARKKKLLRNWECQQYR